MRRESFKFWDLVRLILEILRYPSKHYLASYYFRPHFRRHKYICSKYIYINIFRISDDIFADLKTLLMDLVWKYVSIHAQCCCMCIFCLSVNLFEFLLMSNWFCLINLKVCHGNLGFQSSDWAFRSLYKCLRYHNVINDVRRQLNTKITCCTCRECRYCWFLTKHNWEQSHIMIRYWLYFPYEEQQQPLYIDHDYPGIILYY